MAPAPKNEQCQNVGAPAYMARWRTMSTVFSRIALLSWSEPSRLDLNDGRRSLAGQLL